MANALPLPAPYRLHRRRGAGDPGGLDTRLRRRALTQIGDRR